MQANGLAFSWQQKTLIRLSYKCHHWEAEAWGLVKVLWRPVVKTDTVNFIFALISLPFPVIVTLCRSTCSSFIVVWLLDQGEGAGTGREVSNQHILPFILLALLLSQEKSRNWLVYYSKRDEKCVEKIQTQSTVDLLSWDQPTWPNPWPSEQE